jgi:hypothetical protein
MIRPIRSSQPTGSLFSPVEIRRRKADFIWFRQKESAPGSQGAL